LEKASIFMDRGVQSGKRILVDAFEYLPGNMRVLPGLSVAVQCADCWDPGMFGRCCSSGCHWSVASALQEYPSDVVESGIVRVFDIFVLDRLKNLGLVVKETGNRPVSFCLSLYLRMVQ
jgi:hypothetical protein